MYIFLQLMALPVLRSRSGSFFDGAQAGLRLYQEVEKKTKVLLPV